MKLTPNLDAINTDTRQMIEDDWSQFVKTFRAREGRRPNDEDVLLFCCDMATVTGEIRTILGPGDYEERYGAWKEDLYFNLNDHRDFRTRLATP